jgi:hypothetical protein
MPKVHSARQLRNVTIVVARTYLCLDLYLLRVTPSLFSSVGGSFLYQSFP